MNGTSNIYHKYKNPISSKNNWVWVSHSQPNVHSIVCALDIFFVSVEEAAYGNESGD